MKKIKVVLREIIGNSDEYKSYEWDKPGGHIHEGDVIQIQGSDTMDGAYIVGSRLGSICSECPFSYNADNATRICTMYRSTNAGRIKTLCTIDGRSSAWVQQSYMFTKVTTVMEEL